MNKGFKNITRNDKWAAVDNVLLHELGLARGLMVNYNGDPDWDHNHHEGFYSNICVMRLLFEPVKPFQFCGYHRKVLKECLKFIRVDYYPGDDCANLQLF